jgi:glycosyltransferase involved in cell wall biosynthesis
MALDPSPAAGAGPPVLSLVMPCYNEQECVRTTIRQLLAAFSVARHDLEIVAVDNGSSDRTGELLAEMGREDPRVRSCRVEVNQGYGFGVLSGLPHCRGEWVGIIPADGQVDAEDVVRLFEAARASRDRVVAKARRRFRMDGLTRKLVSIFYNGLMKALWPGLGSLDVNGTPKLLRREVLEVMELRSRGWLLDPEIMIKAHYLGLRTLELNVFARMRSNGVSHVRAETCWEFLKHLLYFRFSREMGEWRREARRTVAPAVAGEASAPRVTERTTLVKT